MMQIRLLIGISLVLMAPATYSQGTIETHPEWFFNPRTPSEDQAEFLTRRAAEANRQTVFIVNQKGNVFTNALESPGSGTGIILEVTPERVVIATNEHVIARGALDGQVLQVAFHVPGEEDEVVPVLESEFSRRLDVGRFVVDPKLLRRAKPEPAPLPVSPEHLAYLLKTGRPVHAFGHPMGGRNNFTFGVLSEAPTVFNRDDATMRVDAPINPGNSGGPLFDTTTGFVIGMNTKKLIGNNVDSIGMAIPIDHILAELKSLSDGTYASSQGFIAGRSEALPLEMLQLFGGLGIIVSQMPDFLIFQQGLKPKDRGVQHIALIDDNSPLQLGDIIIKVGDRFIGSDEKQIIEAVRSAPRSKLKFTILRGSQILDIDVPVIDMQRELFKRETLFASIDGIILQEPLPNEAAEYFPRGRSGVIVTALVPGTTASQIFSEGGIAENSILYRVQVDTEIVDIKNLQDLKRVSDLAEKSKTKVLRLYVYNPVLAKPHPHSPPVPLEGRNGLPILNSSPSVLMLKDPRIYTSRNARLPELKRAFAKSIVTGGSYSFQSVAHVVDRCRATP